MDMGEVGEVWCGLDCGLNEERNWVGVMNFFVDVV